MPLTALDVDDALSLGDTAASDMLKEAEKAYYKPYDDAKRKVAWAEIMKKIGSTYPQLAGLSVAQIEKALRAMDNAKVEELKKQVDQMEVAHG
jgi:hypothetical protein